jgi:hypothetical protein
MFLTVLDGLQVGKVYGWLYQAGKGVEEPPTQPGRQRIYLLKGAAAQESRLPSDNAKEPDVGAEFFLFFKEALRVHQALSPGAFGKLFPFFLKLCTST